MEKDQRSHRDCVGAGSSIEPVRAPDCSTSQDLISNVTSPMAYPCLPNASHGTSVVMPPDTSSPQFDREKSY